MKVLKFGGTSLQTADRIAAAMDIVRETADSSPVVVVVSALGGVTNALSAAADRSVDGEGSDVGDLMARHVEAAQALAKEEDRPQLLDTLHAHAEELTDLLKGVGLVGECSPRTRDAILSSGERLSAMIAAAYMRRRGCRSQAVDARELIVTDDTFGGAHVDLDATYSRLRGSLPGDGISVVTGFVGATPDGRTTTLGRGGSDYTAALIGAALGADAIEIWTDVDGVMSADPRLVTTAFSLEALTYDELMELSHFGAKVVYPPTVHPARTGAIPIIIRNTLNPAFSGTRIVERDVSGDSVVRGISSINRVALLRLEGDGMVGVPGIAARLFGALAAESINVILISQASSEHSICFAIPPDAVEVARSRIEREFSLERGAGLVDDVVVEHDLSVVAAVGAGMRDRPGIAGRVFEVLGDRRINVRAIAQGSSELNISFVVDRSDEPRTLNAIHDAFFRPSPPHASVFLVGLGRVGKTLVSQIEAADASTDSSGPQVDLAGTCNTSEMRFFSGPTESLAADLDAFVARAMSAPRPRVFVDATASDAVPRHYERLLEASVPVVSANKLPVAGSMRSFTDLQAAARIGSAGLYFETTVGAGLPVLSTIRALVATGDDVISVEGVFSGTVAFLMGKLRAGAPFSEAVRTAYDSGYTEPDPREDLSGADVARKLLVVARVSGDAIEPDAVAVEPLLNEPSLMESSVDDFWKGLSALDGAFEERQREATVRGGVLCYLARFERGHARVGLDVVDATHPCASISGTDNVFVITTRRYRDAPIVIRGPGAGPEVTAAGVLADVVIAIRESG